MSDHTITLPSGLPVRYERHGDGRPVVFVHGLLVDGRLWRKVVPALGPGVQAIVPTLPLGAHALPAPPGTDLTPPGLARIVAGLLEALELSDVVLVGNDTGGAICQLVAAHHPERLGALVLTPCDAYENFLPPLVRPLQWLARVPGSARAIFAVLGVRRLRRLPITLGWLSKRPIPDEVVDGWVAPGKHSGAVRRDLTAVLLGIDPRHLFEALPGLRRFPGPVTLAWAREDKLFPARFAERLAGEFTDVRIHWVGDSYTFVPEDQPEVLAAVVSAVAAQGDVRPLED